MEAIDYSNKIQNLKICVKSMLDERLYSMKLKDTATPAPIWLEVLGIYTYALNLSEDDYLNIRFHTGLITGENIFQHWHAYPPVKPEVFADSIGYKFYTEEIPKEYWLSEPPYKRIPKPAGVEYHGKILNGNISRYQSCVSNLYGMGILDKLNNNNNRNIVLEIGGGYGGLAHGLGNIISRNSLYIIVDLPEMLLFSGGYLIVNNPDKNIYVYNQTTFNSEFLNKNLDNYDYALLPNWALSQLEALPSVNLVINMQSFQEMSLEQVTEYLDFFDAKLQGYLYSDNIDQHPFNNDISPFTITSLLSERFDLFPTPEFYSQKNFRDYSDPWFYKCYCGVLRKKSTRLPTTGFMRLLRSKKYWLHNYNQQLKFKCQTDWKREMFWWGRKVLKKFRGDRNLESKLAGNL